MIYMGSMTIVSPFTMPTMMRMYNMNGAIRANTAAAASALKNSLEVPLQSPKSIKIAARTYPAIVASCATFFTSGQLLPSKNSRGTLVYTDK